MTRPFRFGVFGENARSREALLDTARRAEDAGYSTVFIGSLDYIVDEMRARRERYGFSYYVVLDQAMEKVAPIVARLAGT